MVSPLTRHLVLDYRRLEVLSFMGQGHVVVVLQVLSNELVSLDVAVNLSSLPRPAFVFLDI